MGCKERCREMCWGVGPHLPKISSTPPHTFSYISSYLPPHPKTSLRFSTSPLTFPHILTHFPTPPSSLPHFSPHTFSYISLYSPMPQHTSLCCCTNQKHSLFLSFMRFCHEIIGNLSTNAPTKFWGKFAQKSWPTVSLFSFGILSVKTRQNAGK